MPSQHDVVVIGAGLAGLAACVFLQERGLKVLCFDPRPYPHQKVGESLDWSSPALLRRLGIDPGGLLADGVATSKRKIAVCEIGRTPWSAAPPEGVRRSPLRFETATLHVDRAALDARVYERARSMGATFAWERVTEVAWRDDRVLSCLTSAGGRVEAPWFIDATGTARLFSRAMGIPVTRYGQPKVCLWTYFDTPPLDEGTTFFVENGVGYLDWVWDIPITPWRTSVGYVVAAEKVRGYRRAGLSLEAILHQELSRHSRFASLLEGSASLQVESTSFQPYVTERVCGANWLMAGEAASMPDPLTGNGVTSGIRHARHAADCIAGAFPEGAMARGRQRAYSRHVFRLGHAFNAHIERAIYQDAVRRSLGLDAATYVYTFFAFFMNALHARFDPRGPGGMAAFAVLFAAARCWIAGWMLLARPLAWYRGRGSSGGR